MALDTVQNGKGSKPRSHMTFVDDDKWNRIFGKKKKTKEVEKVSEGTKPDKGPNFDSIYKL